MQLLEGIKSLATGWGRKSSSGGIQGVTSMSSPSFAALLKSVFGGGATKSGASVTTESALEVSVVLACTRAIAEGVAQVPWRVMQESPDGRTRVPLKTHPLWMLLHRKPNRWQTSFAFRESLIFHIVTGPRGVAYVFKSRVGPKRRLAELVLLDPHRVDESTDDFGEFKFRVRGKNGSFQDLTTAEVWRIPGPSWTGTEAMPLIKKAREAIGLAMATEETQANLHANGVQTAGTYSVEGTLNMKQQEDLAAWIVKEFGGARKAGRPFVLDRGAKWHPTTMSGVDAQHLETRRHQVEEVCRCLRVLPIMVMQADKAMTYASAEQMFIAHLVHTLLPWYERLEQSADCDLLTDAELSAGVYTLLDPKGMLRGSLKDTAEYISRLVDRGVMVRNEGRELLDLNPRDGLDEPLTPANMLTSTTNDPASAGA